MNDNIIQLPRTSTQSATITGDYKWHLLVGPEDDAWQACTGRYNGAPDRYTTRKRAEVTCRNCHRLPPEIEPLYELDRVERGQLEGQPLISGPVGLKVGWDPDRIVISATPFTKFGELAWPIVEAALGADDTYHLWEFLLPWDARFQPRSWRSAPAMTVLMCPFLWKDYKPGWDRPGGLEAETTPIGRWLLEADQFWLRFDLGADIRIPIEVVEPPST